MGCKYACTCSGNCLGCANYEKESYCGEAEDYYDNIYSEQIDDREPECELQYFYGDKDKLETNELG